MYMIMCMFSCTSAYVHDFFVRSCILLRYQLASQYSFFCLALALTNPAMSEEKEDLCLVSLPKIAKAAKEESTFEEFTEQVKTMVSDLPIYDPCITDMTFEDSALLERHLYYERNRMLNFLEAATQCFQVHRTRISRYIRSCEYSAVRSLESSTTVEGIFHPETHLKIFEAVLKHMYYQADETLKDLEDAIPEALLKNIDIWPAVPIDSMNESAKEEPPDDAEKTRQYSNIAQTKRRRVRESLRKARQRLTIEKGRFSTEWITMQELVFAYGLNRAHEEWQKTCFTTERKLIAGIPSAVTEAVAFAYWRNNDISVWQCHAKWKSAAKADLGLAVPDDEERQDLRRKLHRLLEA